MQIFRCKAVKRISSLVVLILFLLIGTVTVGEALAPIDYATYFNHDIETIEAHNEKVDLVFVGASRVYRSYVPEIFEKKLNMNCVINAGSSSQPECGTYYQLKDLVERVHPEKVVIGVTWDGIIGTEEPSQQAMLIVYDRLSLINKLQFAMNCFETKNLLYCLRPYRFKDYLNYQLVKTIYEAKQTLKKNNYVADIEQIEYYADTGFVFNKKGNETGAIPIVDDDFTPEEEISEEKLFYLDACVKLCQDNDIPVYLVTGVTSMMRIYNSENYQREVDFYTDYAEKHGIIYHNLNYLLNREEILPDELMFDYNHLNGEGANILSEIYAEILEKDMQGIDTSDYFYANLDELKKDVYRIVAVKGDIIVDEEDGNLAKVVVTSLQNENIIPYYQLEISIDGGKSFDILVEWTEESEMEIVLPEEKVYKLKVRARNGEGEDASEAYQIYSFE